MKKNFFISHVLPISAGALAQLFVLYRGASWATAFVTGGMTTLFISELVSPALNQYGMAEGWIEP
jgi:hypothetical protein